MRTVCIVVCFLIVCVGASAQFHAGRRDMSVKEARQLVYLVLPNDTRQLPGLTLLTQRKPRGCITFDVLWSNPSTGSVHVDFYCVNARTAEVWRPTACEQVTSQSLEKAQGSIRRRLGLLSSERLGSDATPACCRIEREANVK